MTDPRPRPARAAETILRPDLPSRAGFDPDHPLASGLVGLGGPSIAHLGDLAAWRAETAQGAVVIDAETTGPWMLALITALAETRPGGTAALEGALCNDVLAQAGTAAAAPWSTAAALDLAADTLSWSRRALPRLQGARLHVPEALGPDGFETALALALRSGLALLAAAARREKPRHLHSAAQGIGFVMPGDTEAHRAAGNVLERLWATLIAERYGASETRHDDLLLYLPGADAPTTVPDIDSLRAALERVEAAGTPCPPCTATLPEEAPRIDRAAALARWRRERDGNAVQKSLLALREAAKRGINVMGPSVACAKAGITTGEWTAVMTGVLPAAAPMIEPAAETGDGDPALRTALAQASRGLSRPITLLLARPGLDHRAPGALLALRALAELGVDLRDAGPRGLPSRIHDAVMQVRPHAILFQLNSPQSVEMARQTLDTLIQAGFGSIPTLGLVDFPYERNTIQDLAMRMPIRSGREMQLSDLVNDIAQAMTPRKKNDKT